MDSEVDSQFEDISWTFRLKKQNKGNEEFSNSRNQNNNPLKIVTRINHLESRTHSISFLFIKNRIRSCYFSMRNA